ncbi:MAG: amidohydrolase family protein [Kofleriaceae bacterium]
MRTLVVAMLALGCSGPTKLPPPVLPPIGPAKPAVTTPPPVAAKAGTVKRVYIASGRKSGTLDITTAADGTVTSKLVIVQNGRGPKVDATTKLAADGTFATFTATGQHEMGTKVAETFTRSGNVVNWKSEEESGERTVTGPAMYIPMAQSFETYGWLVGAALKHGGTLALLPGGEARVAKVAEQTIVHGGETRTVHCYAISGVALSVDYEWMNPDGTWFGSVSQWSSMLPEGWDAVATTLVDVQLKLDRAHDEALAKRVAHRPPAAGIAYTHARVLDVAKHKWLDDHTVVIVGNKITAVGPSKTTKIPLGGETVDLAGKAIVPGLIDMHSHTGPTDGVLDIASGVTTVRDVGNEPDQLDDMKARFDAGTAVGPYIVRFGFVEGRNEKAAASKVTAETVEEANAAVEFFAKRGYEGIKIYNSMKVELVPVIAKLAHKHGMQVTGHIPVHMLANEAVTAGYDGIEHINMLFLNFFATHDTDTRDTTRFTLVGERAATLDLNSKPVKDFFEQLRKKQTVIDPTLAAFEDLFAGESGKITPGLEATVARFPIQTGRGFLRGGLPLTGDNKAKYRASWERILAMVKALHAAKVPVVLGTDHIGGLMLHHEMALFARAGFDPGTILELVTLGAARALKLDKSIGSIAAGKRADLAIIDGDPLADILAIGGVVSTMRGGVIYTSAPLYESAGVLPFKTR